MKVAVIGGAGAMGGVLGGTLAEAGNEVVLVDVARDAVDRINAEGLRIESTTGATRSVHVPATTEPASVGPVDLAIVFTKCYHTENAVRSAMPLLAAHTTVLSLQNGWGNAPKIAALVGDERVLAGVTYHSATVIAPGHVLHTGQGVTIIGELNGGMSGQVERIATAFRDAGLDVSPTDAVVNAIWSKLALNVCTLPTSALLHFYAGQLIEHDGTIELMRALLRETVAVANAQGFQLDESERWETITGLLARAAKSKASMLQDVERGRRTEIEVINGAVVDGGLRLGIATPHNDTVVYLIKALEETF